MGWMDDDGDEWIVVPVPLSFPGHAPVEPIAEPLPAAPSMEPQEVPSEP